MKLATKLPLTFAVTLVMVSFAALYGIYSLNQALVTYATTVKSSQDNERKTLELLAGFKTQVQEWKNILVRGKDPKALDKHWGAFNKIERDIAEKSTKLAATLPPGEAKALVENFVTTHAEMGQKYQKGFESFRAAGFDPTVGDAAVRGMDRAPAKLLDEAGDKIGAYSAATSAQAAALGQRATSVSLILMFVVCSAGLGVGLLLSRSIVRQLGADPDDAVALAQSITAGHLNQPVDLKAGDTTSLMAQLKAMQESLSTVVGNVRQNAEGVATASAQIAQGNQDLSQRTEEQASALEQTAASMEQLNATVKQNADNAKQANQLALGASTVAIQGGDVVGQVVSTMKGINDSSKKISDIISVIDGIAFQTNILALNAAVEAARAGEQGRGFAVVASEVRSLAQRSAEAAKEIKGLINASVERVDQGTVLVDQAGATMTEVVNAIKRVTDIMGEISAASVEQSAGVAQVGEAVNQMDQTTQQNAALVEESAAAAASLNSQAQQLVQTVAVFKVGHSNARTDAALANTLAASTGGTWQASERPVSPATGNVARPSFGKPKLKVAATRPAAATPTTVTARTGTDDWESF